MAKNIVIAVSKSRDITFDVMKGIGILLVMTCHLLSLIFLRF